MFHPLAIEGTIEAILVPDLVNEVLMLKCLVQPSLLLLICVIKALFKSVVEVEVRFQLLIKSILCLLLEFLKDRCVSLGDRFADRCIWVDQVILHIIFVYMVLDPLLAIVDLLLDATQKLSLISVRYIVQAVQVDQLSVAELGLRRPIGNYFLHLLLHLFELWHLDQDFMHFFVREAFEELLTLGLIQLLLRDPVLL